MSKKHPKPRSPKFIDLTDQPFNRWTVKEYAGKDKAGHTLWLCQCQCGTSRIVAGSSLKSNASKSCGCWDSEVVTRRNWKHGAALANTPEWNAWRRAKSRCENPQLPTYKHYGGRGITICDRWRNSFPNFLADVGPRPSPQHSLERQDVDGPYSPENCIWASHTVQMRNTTRNHFLTFRGETRAMSEWAEILHMNYSTLRARIASGLSDEEALTRPLRRW